jgi:hypothetical protein
LLTNDDYRATYQALNVCIAARVPVILWGPPGQGKTSVIRAIASHSGRKLETVLASIREPQDFAGLPSINNGRAQLVPPDWALRLAEDGNGILFTDEVNTAPPSVQAALLRVCLDQVAGDCYLGDKTRIIAAANPPEQAADGWDLAAPLANRFCHLEWSLPSDVVRDGLAGVWPSFDLPNIRETHTTEFVAGEKLTLAGFLTSRPNLTTVLPKSSGEQGRAFPTPRSWEAAATLSGWVSALGLEESVRRMLILGAVGHAASSEFLTYRANHDLPKPKDLLKDPHGFQLPKRADLLYVIAAAIMAEVRNNPSEGYWPSAGIVLERIAKFGSPDIAVSIARDWLKIRPANLTPDTSVLQSLIPLLREAKLI